MTSCHTMMLFAGAVLASMLASGCGDGGGGHGGDDAGATPTTVPSSVATPVASAIPSVAPTATVAPTPGAAVAWAVGAALLRSDDGGFTWRDTEVGRFSGVAFADRAVGWIVDSVTVYGTDDGGRSWDDRYPDVVGGAPQLFDVAALDARHVVAVGQYVTLGTERHTSPAIVYSDDAAATWQRAVLPEFAPDRVDGIQLLSVCVGASGIGLASGSDLAQGNRSLVLVTIDGGHTWQDATARLPREMFGKSACGSDGSAWFLGADSTVQRSVDGGLTWQSRRSNLPSGLALWGGAFPGDGVGWLVAVTPLPNPRVVAFRSTDDGASWTESPAGGDLNVEIAWASIDAISADRAVIVAQDARALAPPRSSFGRSWATIDGGTTWAATQHPTPTDALLDVDLVP